MRIKRIFTLAGLALAGGMLTGCWGDCWCTGGSSRGSQPKTTTTATETSSLGQQREGWNKPLRSQELNVANSPTTQPSPAALGGSVTGQPAQTSSTAPTTASNAVDTAPSVPSPVRTVSGSVPVGTSNLNPPPPDLPPAATTQRDSRTETSPIVAPQPPSLPPPPPSLPPAGAPASSTSKYTPSLPPATNRQLPPESIPNQSKIPTLPPGPVPAE